MKDNLVIKLMAFIGRNWPFQHGTGWLIERPARLIRKWPQTNQFQLKDGRVFCGDLNDPVFRSLYLYGKYEPLASTAIHNLVKAGDTIVDVGANVGVLTTLMGRLVGPLGHVYSFEPIPPLFDKLVFTISMNGLSDVVTPIKMAVWQASGENASIYLPLSQSHACSSFKIENPGSATAYTCSTIALSDAAFIQKVPTLVKVDVEGAELAVLHGAKVWCQDICPPIWILEVNRRAAARFDYVPEDLVEWLVQYDYCHFYWSGDRVIRSYAPGEQALADGMIYALPRWADNIGRTPLQAVKG